METRDMRENMCFDLIKRALDDHELFDEVFIRANSINHMGLVKFCEFAIKLIHEGKELSLLDL